MPDCAGNAAGLGRSGRLRAWIARNLPLAVFLLSYFLTTVLGNLAYPFRFGSRMAQVTISHFDLSHFSTVQSAGYWLLLFLPFLLMPPVAVATRAALSRRRLTAALGEFRTTDYVIILAICYGYVAYEFWRADVVGWTSFGKDPTASLWARFRILAALGFWPQMVLKSLLMFLSVYSFVKALQSREVFWIGAAVCNLILMSVLLALLNMKWPALILFVSLAICAFLFSSRPYLHAAIAIGCLVLAYVVIALMVWRALPTEEIGTGNPPPTAVAPATAVVSDRQPAISSRLDQIATTGEMLLMNVLNRTALGYPYYYQEFTDRGQVCGTIVDRIRRKPSPCHPSTLIYARISGNDPFVGQGTQPAAVHITGYALGGWPGALIALVVTAIIVGAFMSLPCGPSANATMNTVAVMGGLAGYFFSQLPVEGPIVYDHGILWWSILLGGYILLRGHHARLLR